MKDNYDYQTIKMFKKQKLQLCNAREPLDTFYKKIDVNTLSMQNINAKPEPKKNKIIQK